MLCPALGEFLRITLTFCLIPERCHAVLAMSDTSKTALLSYCCTHCFPGTARSLTQRRTRLFLILSFWNPPGVIRFAQLRSLRAALQHLLQQLLGSVAALLPGVHVLQCCHQVRMCLHSAGRHRACRECETVSPLDCKRSQGAKVNWCSASCEPHVLCRAMPAVPGFSMTSGTFTCQGRRVGLLPVLSAY